MWCSTKLRRGYADGFTSNPIDMFAFSWPRDMSYSFMNMNIKE